MPKIGTRAHTYAGIKTCMYASHSYTHIHKYTCAHAHASRSTYLHACRERMKLLNLFKKVLLALCRELKICVSFPPKKSFVIICSIDRKTVNIPSMLLTSPFWALCTDHIKVFENFFVIFDIYLKATAGKSHQAKRFAAVESPTLPATTAWVPPQDLPKFCMTQTAIQKPTSEMA